MGGIKVKVVTHRIDYGADEEILSFSCPGCKKNHNFKVYGFTGRVHTWNGLQQKATVLPEMEFGTKLSTTEPLCKCSLHNGDIVYSPDCEHKLAGETIAMVEFTEKPEEAAFKIDRRENFRRFLNGSYQN